MPLNFFKPNNVAIAKNMQRQEGSGGLYSEMAEVVVVECYEVGG